ncbi:LysR substrate-binding domain-containing protein [Streptomyces noursei]|uniref:LysR substrate-binding domain-containing protein n=1 Tax=Streptomyces noursei TaxID=1971 RepID=UPI0030F00E69
MIARYANIDLNLLIALDALLEEESVTGAAGRIGLSGPAMSRALGRIRRTVGDPILVRAGRPLAARPLTVRRYADAPHLNFSRRGRLTGPIDAALADHGLRRRVIATVPTLAAALMMVRDSDAVGMGPERAGASMIRELGLRTLPVPLDLPPLRMVMAWHPRQDADPGHVWLRGVVRATVAAVVA